MIVCDCRSVESVKWCFFFKRLYLDIWLGNPKILLFREMAFNWRNGIQTERERETRPLIIIKDLSYYSHTGQWSQHRIPSDVKFDRRDERIRCALLSVCRLRAARISERFDVLFWFGLVQVPHVMRSKHNQMDKNIYLAALSNPSISQLFDRLFDRGYKIIFHRIWWCRSTRRSYVIMMHK